LSNEVLDLLNGKKIDKMLWAPRLKLWYEYNQKKGSLPNSYRGLKLIEIEKKLGAKAGSTARLRFNHRHQLPMFPDYTYQGHVVKSKFRSIKVEVKKSNNKQQIIYKTPIGDVSEIYGISEMGFENYLVENLIKKDEDYEIVKYVYDDIKYISDYESYNNFNNELGEHGVPLLSLYYDPMFLIMDELLGYNRFFFELNDNKKKVEDLYEFLCNKFLELQDVVLQSPAKLVMGAIHYDSKIISPSFYNEYMKPYLKPLAQELKKRNKMLAFHADADSRNLMNDILETGIEYADCFLCAPMASITFEEALDIWEPKS